ncbi:S1C family serine protease [Sinorhizobium meliloti]|uniref:S1C family serine protease n=1 Tax=Rhizobium meliloti TaxID=382 RepID=UPI0013E2D12B|nr:serine protease [Sinorhizobium meliloti]
MHRAYLGAAVATLFGLLLALLYVPGGAARQMYPPATASAALKVDIAGGHGSGVSIGNGFVITAGHVAKGSKTVTLKTKDGKTRQADVLWINEEYDIALLRSDDRTMPAAKLDCRMVTIGEVITAYGNPGSVEFVAAFGRVAGEARVAKPWESVLVTDIASAPGMSGGPVFDADRHLVGITVGGLVASLGQAPSLVGIGFIVPSKSVCDLLARDVPA